MKTDDGLEATVFTAQGDMRQVRTCVRAYIMYSTYSVYSKPSVRGHLLGYCGSALFDILCIDMCTLSPQNMDTLLWSQWCSYYRVSLYRAPYCGPNGVLIEFSLYVRTLHGVFHRSPRMEACWCWCSLCKYINTFICATLTVAKSSIEDSIGLY